MTRFVRHHRLGIARQALPAMLLITALLAMVFTMPNFADEPPSGGGEYVASDSDDLDADGTADTTIANPSGTAESEPGNVEVISGDNDETIAIIFGNEADDSFGYSVSTSCDLNGDDAKDLIAGAPKELDGKGRAYAFYGPLGESDTGVADQADLILDNPDEDAVEFGRYVECLPDVDGDGMSDILVEALHKQRH